MCAEKEELRSMTGQLLNELRKLNQNVQDLQPSRTAQAKRADIEGCIKAIQKELYLDPDGVLGPKTLAALRGQCVTWGV